MVDRIKTEGFWEFMGTLCKILSDLDPEYWTAYAGFDGSDWMTQPFATCSSRRR